MAEPYGKIAVIGCGLIGSSLLRAAREKALAGDLAVADRDPAVLARARELELADSFHDDAAAAATGADLVVLAVPVGAMEAVAREVVPAMKPGAVLSDVGSVKGAVAGAMTAATASTGGRDDIHLIPAHPVAGAERSGPDAGFASLFQDRWTILTPRDRDDAAYLTAVDRLAGFWRALGARTEIMAADRHDLILAVTSHLPHLIAYNLVGAAADLEAVTEAEVMKYSAGGFRDFTRIAASDPVMWRDIFLANRDAVLEVLARFTADLNGLGAAIDRGDGDALHALFTRTRDIRRGVIELGQDTSEPNFGRDRMRKPK